VKNSKEYASKFSAQIKKLKKQSAPLEMADPVDVLVYSQLLCESTTAAADEAWSRLCDAKIDWHEIRVSTPAEIAEMCGDKSALAEDRGARIKAMLNHLYQRHHDVTMAPELDLGKRDLRDAIESLDGMTHFVATRWLLLCGEVGGVPVDDQLCWMLGNAGCVDEDAPTGDIAAWVCRQIKADDAWQVHATLQAWVNGQSDRVAKKRAKDKQARDRQLKKVRDAAIAQRSKAQKIAHAKRVEAAERAAARRAAAERAEAEAAKAPPKKKVAKKAVAKKKTGKKAPTTKKTTKKTPKKTTKKTSKKAPAKKRTTKKTPAKKKVTKKKVTKKASARKATVKKSASRKKTTKKSSTRKKTRK